MNRPVDLAVAASAEPEALKTAFLDDIRELGYAEFDAFCINPDTINSPAREGNWAVASYDMGRIRDYLLDGYAAMCPILAEAGRSLRPYNYPDLLDRFPENPSVKWQRRILAISGVRHAWVVPLSSVGYVKGVTVYMRGRTASQQKRFEETRDDIHLRAARFFEALEAMSPEIPGEMRRALWRAGALTEREAECVRWASEGKTNPEIAVIMGISENTVRYYFKNIFDRLGARSRAQAVALFRAAPTVPGAEGDADR